ncbi:FecR domain-containing protein [Sorangium sp. So ce1024]|uniref:tetratricopeptide repeat protein n=1 Tax=Sorangium sp. So ce1024 TaxID=3133327 RepID=UPI003EFCEAA8
MGHEPQLREWVRPPLTEGGVARQWQRIEERLDASGARLAPRWLWAGGLAGALALGAAALWVGGRGEPADAPTAAARASASVLSLSDGSTIALDEGAELDVQRDEPRHIAAVLRSGAARFDVAPDPARPFTVTARGVVVRVVGTAFRVAVDGASEEVSVAVTQGVVEVHHEARPGEVKRLRAGESWSTAPEAAPATPQAEPPGDAPPPPPEGAPATPPEGAPATPQGGTALARPAQPPAAAGSPGAPAAQGPAAAAAPGADAAQKLFEAANQARRAGDLERAAALYRQLVAKHPGDARAQIAALELGRIEMERGKGANAEDALRTAASSSAGSSVHEDALARLVRLYDSQGKRDACEEARRRYLATYPNGVHAAAVRSACGSR